MMLSQIPQTCSELEELHSKNQGSWLYVLRADQSGETGSTFSMWITWTRAEGNWTPGPKVVVVRTCMRQKESKIGFLRITSRPNWLAVRQCFRKSVKRKQRLLSTRYIRSHSMEPDHRRIKKKKFTTKPQIRLIDSNLEKETRDIITFRTKTSLLQLDWIDCTRMVEA